MMGEPAEVGIMALLRPVELIMLSGLYLPITALHLLRTYQFSKLMSWTTFQHAWFGRFWAYFGPLSARNSVAVIRPLLGQAEGVVLDVGPGNGEWIHLLGPAKNSDISHIFGVEPNKEHHPSLRRCVADSGLEGVYEILDVGAENLDARGIGPQSIDTICTIQCLCSMSNPERVVRDLYPYLKSGGKWLFFEHVRTKHQNNFVGYWQSLYINRSLPIFH